MRYPLEVCLVALTLTTSMTPTVAANSPAAARAAQALQKGISVELPATRNAVPMPDADQAGALIVSVTHDGSAYLGIKPISAAALAEDIKGRLSDAAEKKLYVKADARARYAGVVEVLEAVRKAGVEMPILLTAQRAAPEQGIPVPPYGLEVLVGPPLHYDSMAAVVQLLSSGQQRPRLKINGEYISWANLQSALRHFFQKRREKVVLVRAEGTLPYADVVHVTDISRSVGARVALVTQGL